uniref:Mitochondrial import inner membrane translocase subunit TIM50 n=1 Tax=Solanum lycopersicum TaxID=4081 RepID=K4CQS6_SOLLC
MAQKIPNLKLKNVISHNDNYSDDESKNKISGKLELYLPLEKLYLGPKKKLIVLNLGGLLVHRVHKRDWFSVRTYKPDLVCGNFKVFKRPFCEPFLKFCLERFEVGIWSSAMERNMDAILDNIMVGLRRKLLFVWDQEKCIDSGFKCLEKKEKPIFLKQMKKIWENKYNILPFRGGKFSESNTIMIDDEPHTALINPPNTAIFPHVFKVGNGKDTFLGPEGDLQKFLDGLVDANDVPTYVKEHSLIGQPAITTFHPDWNYYAKIIVRFVGIKKEVS